MRYTFLIVLLQVSFLAISQNKVPHFNNPVKKIGYIEPDEALDNPVFKVCDESNIHEYYQINPQFKEGMISIHRYFDPKLDSLNSSAESDGVIVIRFVINCEGQTGRFRSKFFDLNYKKVEGNIVLQKELIEELKKMGSWTSGNYNGKKYDAYQHIKFRIIGNEISTIFF